MMSCAQGWLDTVQGRRRFVRLDGPGLASAPRLIQLLAENILRHGGAAAEDAVADLLAGRGEIPFRPYRVVMQDYAGLPALLDMAAVREARAAVGLDPAATGLACPVDLVVDHSIRADARGSGAAARNLAAEYAENAERFGFLRWAEQAFAGLRIVPPGNGIVHQVNLEVLGTVAVQWRDWVIPDSLLGTDSHTTMIGGMGVLGWGVGGLEATAALLGLPLMLPSPAVVGVRLTGQPAPGVLATDIALRLTERLRREGVVGCLLEFFGDGVEHLSVPDRATLANMSPEYGATCAFFPADAQTIRFMSLSGRSDSATLAEAHARAAGLWGSDGARNFPRVIEVALASILPTVAGPSLPQQARSLRDVPRTVRVAGPTHPCAADGDLAIAAITSCTNTANPAAMVAAGLLARNALAAGLSLPPRLKATLSPGSLATTRYLDALGLLAPLQALGFGVAGYGCMTCVGNSGEIDPDFSAASRQGVHLAAVLSGNRNFEGRIHPAVRAAYLASPPLVVAYALAGNMRTDLTAAPLGQRPGGSQVFLSELWPPPAEIAECAAAIPASCWTGSPDRVDWDALPQPNGPLFPWAHGSTYLQRPVPTSDQPGEKALPHARPLLILGDDVTTDHISPVGRIAVDSPAGRYLSESGERPSAFNSYGARRGNIEVMRRGTFANPRLRNALADPKEGAWTRYFPDGEMMKLFDAAALYARHGVATVVLAGRNYGTGSARDWAAKGVRALGVKAVVVHSFERIHRANLALVGVLPLEVLVETDWTGVTAVSLAAASAEMRQGLVLPLTLERDATREIVEVKCRLDTEFELACWRAGGLLPLAALDT